MEGLGEAQLAWQELFFLPLGSDWALPGHELLSLGMRKGRRGGGFWEAVCSSGQGHWMAAPGHLHLPWASPSLTQCLPILLLEAEAVSRP